MATPAPSAARYTAERYFALVEEGLLGPDDRVELLDGVIVAMAPQSPRHASAARHVERALRAAIGERAVISVQSPFVAGASSVPEPDVAVVPGQLSDYDREHPATALLIVEVADSSLIQDRITKASMYAAAGAPEYWLVNLHEDCVEIFRAPEPEARRYAERRVTRRGERLALAAFAAASVAVDDLLPGR